MFDANDLGVIHDALMVMWKTGYCTSPEIGRQVEVTRGKVMEMLNANGGLGVKTVSMEPPVPKKEPDKQEEPAPLGAEAQEG